MNIRLKALYRLLILFALFNSVKWGLHLMTNDYHPIDFRTYYLSSEAYWNGMDPYSDQDQNARWKIYLKKSGSSWETATGFPHASAVYAPQFVWFFGLYNLLDFNLAKNLQFILNIVSFFGIFYCIRQLNPQIDLLFSIFLILSFRGTWYALNTGQPMLQALAICLFALVLIRNKSLSILPALLLALASFKFTLILPFLLLLITEKRYKILMVYCIAVILMNALPFIRIDEPLVLLDHWRNNMELLWAYPHQYGVINELNIISTSVSVPLIYFSNISLQILKPLMLFLLIVSYLFVFSKRKKMQGSEVLFIAALSGMCFGQHLIYDLLALIVYRLCTLTTQDLQNKFEFALLLFLIFPIGEIAIRTQLPMLNMLLPFMLFFYCVICFRNYFLSRYNPTKNPSWIK